jgi:putative ABC transport system ATP-binding protein
MERSRQHTKDPVPMPASSLPTPVAAHDVSLRVGDGRAATVALRGISLAARAGELTAVVGPSGSGKTSLLHVLAGLDRPTTGAVTLAGRPLGALDEREATRLRRDHVGILLPDAPALPTITVRENVALPLLIARRAPEPGVVEAMLARVGLAERMHHRPGELTAGECRRAGLARALLGGPSVLLADEPLAGLPGDEARGLLELLRAAAHEDGVAVVVFTRDETLAAEADAAAHLDSGRIAGAALPLAA